jgi:outer membrane lipoprotein SlyB
MSLASRLSALILGAAAVLPLAVGHSAFAQRPQAISADSFQVDAVRSLRPGTELAFNLRATPAADVTLSIVGATAGVRMNEVQPGVYEGNYTVRSRDRLTASSLVNARILKDGRTLNVALDQSLVQGAQSPVPVSRILAFSVNAPERVRPGDELKFSLAGVPGGEARVAVKGLAQPVALTEVSRGLYEGSHTLSRKERLRGELSATGYLKVGQQEASQRFTRDRTPDANAYGCDRSDGRDKRRPDMAGATCGVVTAIGKAEVDDENSRNVLGTLAGGVLGGVIGNQVGGGSGKDIARIVGALGGAYAGNRIQNSREKTTVYRITVQLDDGGSQNFDHAVDPVLPVGARVKIVDGAIVRR